MYRIHLRLAKTDLDLIHLFTCYNGNKLILAVIRAHLSGSDYSIPLPPPTKERPKRTVMISLRQPDDQDIIDWCDSFRPGNKTIVIKTLVRWYMEAPDFRLFLQSGQAQAPSSAIRGKQLPIPPPKKKQPKPTPEKQPDTPRPASTKPRTEEGEAKEARPPSPLDLI